MHVVHTGDLERVALLHGAGAGRHDDRSRTISRNAVQDVVRAGATDDRAGQIALVPVEAQGIGGHTALAVLLGDLGLIVEQRLQAVDHIDLAVGVDDQVAIVHRSELGIQVRLGLQHGDLIIERAVIADGCRNEPGDVVDEVGFDVDQQVADLGVDELLLVIVNLHRHFGRSRTGIDAVVVADGDRNHFVDLRLQIHDAATTDHGTLGNADRHGIAGLGAALVAELRVVLPVHHLQDLDFVGQYGKRTLDDDRTGEEIVTCHFGPLESETRRNCRVVIA